MLNRVLFAFFIIVLFSCKRDNSNKISSYIIKDIPSKIDDNFGTVFDSTFYRLSGMSKIDMGSQNLIIRVWFYSKNDNEAEKCFVIEEKDNILCSKLISINYEYNNSNRKISKINISEKGLTPQKNIYSVLDKLQDYGLFEISCFQKVCNYTYEVGNNQRRVVFEIANKSAYKFYSYFVPFNSGSKLTKEEECVTKICSFLNQEFSDLKIAF